MCEHLREEGLLRTLVSLAVTNKIVCEIALDVLWEKQESLVHFVQAIPQHNVHRHTWQREFRLEIEGDIPDEDWDRVQTYARRVKSLRLSFSGNSDYGDWRYFVAEETVDYLGLCAGEAPIFPNLQELDFRGGDDDPSARDLALLPTFLSRTLRSLTICPRISAQTLKLLPTIPPACPDLHEIRIEDPPRRQYAKPRKMRLPYEKTIPGWRALTWVAIDDAHPDTLRHLSQLPDLQILDLTLSGEYEYEWTPATTPGFVNGLKRLSLWLSASWHPVFLIRALSNTPIAVEKVIINVAENPAEDGDRARLHNLNTIAQMITPDSLAHFRYAHTHEEEPPAQKALPAETLVQFAKFTRMKEFHVDARFDVQDSHHATLAAAWPALECLSIHPQQPFEWKRIYPLTGATLASVASFGQSCPVLHEFKLDGLDARVVPPFEPAPSGHAPGRVVKFEHYNCPIKDSAAVAAFLHAAFCGNPRISLPFYITEVRPPYTSRWNAVAPILDDLQRYTNPYEMVQASPGSSIWFLKKKKGMEDSAE
ncbi:hypothetical protein K523DRAFT_298067 [Schizophyllum commune Tattone D]|nr:hypothetical protein K523DRAFT_298067 [Schizophyllum commune Tattone D]